jgi:hypothetical protein
MENLDGGTSRDLDDLIIELNIYIDNMQPDARFAQVATISKLGKMMVDTNKKSFFSFGISVPQTCASYSYCDGVGGKVFLSSENCEDGLTNMDDRTRSVKYKR